MPEAAFHALTDELKQASKEAARTNAGSKPRIAPHLRDPYEEGRRIANESAADFREAIKLKRAK